MPAMAVIVFAALAVVAMLLLPVAAEVRVSLPGDGSWEVRLLWRPAPGLILARRSWRGRLRSPAPERVLDGVRDLRRTLRGGRARLLVALAPWAPLLVLARFGRPRRLTVAARYGGGDAARSALAAGLARALLAAAAGLLSARRGPLTEPPRLDVRPAYEGRLLQVEARCILAAHLRDIMLALLWPAAAGVLRRLGKGGKAWTATPSKA